MSQELNYIPLLLSFVKTENLKILISYCSHPSHLQYNKIKSDISIHFTRSLLVNIDLFLTNNTMA
jgi:hypothetical protein